MENSEEQKLHLFSEGQSFKLYEGSMLDMFDVIEPNSIDAIVTDPPYELGFMSKSWDSSGIAFQKETWEKCLKVLKPGGYLLAFGGSRTFHRIACAIEDAGFEIRDTILWLYGSGFPKSMNIGLAVDKKNGVESPVIGQNETILKKQAKDIREGHRKSVDSYNAGASERNNGFSTVSADIKKAQNEWDGWGTQLKPAYEPIIVARKPCEGSCIDNVLKYGVGGINIDECRVGTDVITTNGARKNPMAGDERTGKALGMFQETGALNTDHTGRFPANVILTYDETDFDEVCGSMPTSGRHGSVKNQPNVTGESGIYNSYGDHPDFTTYTDEGSAARYFYCAKASKRDRDEGLPEGKHNIHPTVKNTDLMQYLVRLVTPKGGTILDPFNGSGSTGKAAMYENKDRNAGYKYIGIELTSEYLPISDARIRYAIGDTTPVEYKTPTNPPTLKKPSSGFTQISLFDLPE